MLDGTHLFFVAPMGKARRGLHAVTRMRVGILDVIETMVFIVIRAVRLFQHRIALASGDATLVMRHD